MLFEFQVVYRLNALSGLSTVAVRAKTEEEAKAIVLGGDNSGVVVHSVGPGAPVLDPAQRTYDSQEACAYLHCALTTLNQYMNFDWLPKFKGGKPVFTREQLDAVLKRGAEEELPWRRGKAA